MDELVALEKQIYIVVQREEEVIEEKAALLKELKVLKDENEILRIKLDEAEKRVEQGGEISGESTLFDSESKEVVKNKIDELINKIDNHLRS
jgi:uncharacterized protein YlzI (FlbEa/FlbD family)